MIITHLIESQMDDLETQIIKFQGITKDSLEVIITLHSFRISEDGSSLEFECDCSEPINDEEQQELEAEIKIIAMRYLCTLHDSNEDIETIETHE